ncbi:MAG: hypothetical protein ASARMPREDX12_006411 [Alectoria sarmentosa]|nr:MAG: hypothetical protein ASARMPREDX12_006411 [Alectoria sarmentosa]
MAITRSHPFNQRAGTPATPKKASFHPLLNRVRDRPGAVISKQLRVNQGAKKRARGPGAQLQAELESAVLGIVPAKDYKGKLRFLFVPYPDVRDIAEETHLAIDASNTSSRFLARYPMYSAENMSTIQQELGKGFASHGMTSTKPYYEIPILHQGVVTMLHLSHSFNRDVTIKCWKWLQAQLETVTARSRSASSAKVHHTPPRKPPSHQRRAQQHPLFSDSKTSCIIFLHWTIDPGPPTANIYAAIATIQSTRPHHLFRAFPSQTELTHETTKLPDIHALNAIASTSPQKYAYRPRTCLTHGERNHDPTRCPLRGQRQIIMKRTHSCGGEHVQLIDGDSALPRHREPSTDPAIPHRWFGQSYEPFFSRFGEFRVFIAARPSPSLTALRGRKGRILHTVVTEWVCAHDPGAMYARVATPQDFTDDASVRPLTATDLHDFALYIYDALRSRDDWREHYESLEMGVRLDVGVASKRTLRKEGGKRGRGEEKRFFVNEITRFYGADYFSQHTLGAPQQEVCWAFAEAVDGYFGSEKVEVKDER